MDPTIDSRHLRIYVTLARTMNMSRAAAELRMTPSGVSHCLKALESDLGCRLFDRNPRKFEISQVGRKFLADAEAILDQMRRVRGKIKGWSSWRQGQLAIGANGTASHFLLPPALREFRESFPDFTIKIGQCSTEKGVAMIKEGNLDLALLIEPAVRTPGTEFLLIGEDDLQFIVNPLHTWAVKRKVQREDISNRKLILPGREGSTYALIESYFRRENIRLQPLIEIANEQAIKEFVRLNLGVGILPRWMVAAEIKDGSLIALPLGRRRLKRRWGVLRSRARPAHPSETLFANISRNIFRGLIESSGV